MKIHDNHILILCAIHESRTHHISVSQMHESMSILSEKTIAKLVKELSDNGYIGFHKKDPLKGASSQYLYHLKLKGAREIGVERLATSFYVQPSQPFADYRRLQIEIKEKAVKQGLLVVDEESECQATITNYIARFTGEYKRYVSHIAPDFLIIANNAIRLFIIMHPSAGRQKFLEKMKQYEKVCHFITLSYVCSSKAHVQLFQETLVNIQVPASQVKFYLPKDFEG